MIVIISCIRNIYAFFYFFIFCKLNWIIYLILGFLYIQSCHLKIKENVETIKSGQMCKSDKK